MKKRLSIATIALLLIMAVFVLPAQAISSFQFMANMPMTGDCGPNTLISGDIQITGTTDDGGGSDYFSIVLYDNTLLPISFGSGAAPLGTTTVPYATTVALNTPTLREFSVFVYDIPAPATTLAEATNGPRVGFTHRDPTSMFGSGAGCLALPQTAPWYYVNGLPPSSPSQIQPFLPSDGRINTGGSSNYAVIFPSQDSEGNPSLHVYCVIETGNATAGILGLVIEQAAIDEFPAQPEENVTVSESNTCNVGFYILTTGEYQINIGPDEYGKITSVIFTGMPPTNVYYIHFSIYGD